MKCLLSKVGVLFECDLVFFHLWARAWFLSHRDPIGLIMYGILGLLFAVAYRVTSLRSIVCHSFYNVIPYIVALGLYLYLIFR